MVQGLQLGQALRKEKDSSIHSPKERGQLRRQVHQQRVEGCQQRTDAEVDRLSKTPEHPKALPRLLPRRDY